jgi:hypothetical protein
MGSTVIATGLAAGISDAEARVNVCVWLAVHDDFAASFVMLSVGKYRV